MKRTPLTVQIGDREVLEQERLEFWRTRTPQQRWVEFEKLLKVWWRGYDTGLRGTIRYIDGSSR